ncbi:MAG: S41 family peptidase, partial [Defluviitaleaceae bacterium]|nr:S41 family peptidase [Defluviitaleaceae bacterium]
LFTIVFVNYDYLIFKTLISRHYIHTETLDAMFYEHLGIDPEGRYSRYFDNFVIALVTAEIRSTGNDPYTFLFTPQQRAAHEERIAQEASEADFFEIASGIVYLKIPNISPSVENFIHRNRREIANFDSIIIDLRGNPGGELASSQAIAGLFLPRRAVVNFEQARWDFWPFTRERRASGSQFFEFENIVILQDGWTASAAEVMITALQANLDNVTTIGETTFGKAVGQVLIPLRRGFAVNSTAITIHTPDMSYIHGVGVAPDIAHSPSDALEAALDFLQGARP